MLKEALIRSEEGKEKIVITTMSKHLVTSLMVIAFLRNLYQGVNKPVQKSKKKGKDWGHFWLKNPLKPLRGSTSFSNWKFKCVMIANTFESESWQRPFISSSSK